MDNVKKKPVIADENDYNEAEVLELESTLQANEKKLDLPHLGVVFVKNPNLKVQSEVNHYYSKIYTELITKNEFFSTRKLEKLLEENGSWTKEDDNNLEELRQSMVNKKINILQINENKKLTSMMKKQIEQLEMDYKKQEEKYLSDSLYKYGLFDNSLERKAENAAIYYKIWKCTSTEKNTPVWATLEEMLSTDYAQDFEHLMYECVSFWRGADSPLLENYQTLLDGNKDIVSE